MSIQNFTISIISLAVNKNESILINLPVERSIIPTGANNKEVFMPTHNLLTINKSTAPFPGLLKNNFFKKLLKCRSRDHLWLSWSVGSMILSLHFALKMQKERKNKPLSPKSFYCLSMAKTGLPITPLVFIKYGKSCLLKEAGIMFK